MPETKKNRRIGRKGSVAKGLTPVPTCSAGLIGAIWGRRKATLKTHLFLLPMDVLLALIGCSLIFFRTLARDLIASNLIVIGVLLLVEGCFLFACLCDDGDRWIDA